MDLRNVKFVAIDEKYLWIFYDKMDATQHT